MDNLSPSGGNTSTAPRILLASGILLITALVIYAVRMYNRLRPKYNLQTEDYLISVAMAS
jgi:hypothetical protein